MRGAKMIPAIARPALAAPGDIAPRPHPNCYWLIPGQVLAGEHPGALVHAMTVRRVDALLDAGTRLFVDLTDEREGPGPYVAILYERARYRGFRVAHRR